MKKKWLIMALVGLSTSLLGQGSYYQNTISWVNIHNGWKILPSDHDTYLVASEVFSNANNRWNACIIELNQIGEMINGYADSSQIYQSAIRDMVRFSNSYIAFGLKRDIVGNDDSYSYVFKIDNSLNIGNYIPNSSFQNVAYKATITIDNKILLAGQMFNDTTDPPTIELHLMKVDSMGIEQWNRTYYAFTKNNSYEDIIALADGTFYGLATVRNDYLQEANVALLHLSSEGIPITIKEYDLGGRDLARCLIATHDGGVLFSASAYPTNDPTEVVQHLYKLDSSGATQWINNADYFVGAVIRSMVQLADSTYIVAGSDYSADPNFLQGFIAKLDSTGQVLWRRSYGGNRDEYIYDLIANHQDTSGLLGYVMCGRTESSDLGVPLGNANLYLLKTNCMGLLTKPQASFATTIDTASLTAAFHNLSQFVYPDSIDGGHFVWDFGDGATSADINPMHTYAQSGSYEVTLTAVVCSDTSVFVQNICIGTLEQPTPSFVYSLQSDTLVSFTNTSSNAEDAVFIWDFGDGTFSSEQNPTHAYNSSGEHEVRLSVILCQDTTMFVQQVSTWVVGVSASLNDHPWSLSEVSEVWSLSEAEVQVLPNPAQDYLVVENHSLEQNASFVLYDVMGKEVARQALSVNSTTVKTEHLPSGVYLYHILNPQKQILTYGKVSVLH